MADADVYSKGRKWYHWYHPADSHAERKLVAKLDLLIVTYAFITYWAKYLDQSNLNNAYVSGMSDDLGFEGNELVHFQTMYNLGAVLGQLPFALLFPKIRMNILVPALDILWGVFTLLQYRAQGYSEIMAYRFLVGLFESAFFPAVHYVLGSWYRGDEINRRGGVFYVGLTLGTLTASLIQSACSANLDGVHGLAGWRWMFIINSIITLPLGLVGFWLWPGTPDNAKSIFLSKEELALAKERLERAGHTHDIKPVSWEMAKKVFLGWKLWILVLWDIFFWNACLNASTAPYLLWLKSLKRYSRSRLNDLSATAPGLGIFYVLFICFGADLVFGRPWAITIAHSWNLLGVIILLIWNVPESAKLFAFNTSYSSVAMSSVLYGWANDILKHDVNERSFTLVAMNAIAQSTTVWTPLIFWKTVEAPRYVKGFSFTAASAICLIAMTWIVHYFHQRQEREFAAKHAEVASSSDYEVRVCSPPKHNMQTSVNSVHDMEA
ncbi:MFS general substrate transporter [Aureobasidium pullulans]|uniref:MFS general substrate transporter n=1 Tax=Aureobasidium pullulans TaxID=5580 RepID=A0A4S9DVB6_AURPU|nr:MFS general substrate transporter [Aureobasidium pullulans]